jgi:hypothetical protein
MCKTPKLMKPETTCARIYCLRRQHRIYISVSAPVPTVIATFPNIQLVNSVNRLQTGAYTSNQSVVSVPSACRTWSKRLRIPQRSTPHMRPATSAQQEVHESSCTLHELQAQLPRRRYWYWHMPSLIFALRWRLWNLPHPLPNRESLKGEILGILEENVTEIESSAKPER